jgi:hypothetical protein
VSRTFFSRTFFSNFLLELSWVSRTLCRRLELSVAANFLSPRKRTPQSMGRYAGVIERRMAQMGW